jgi:hypothetical protein
MHSGDGILWILSLDLSWVSNMGYHASRGLTDIKAAPSQEKQETLWCTVFLSWDAQGQACEMQF